MKLEKWALVSEILGSVAIVATLVILVVELRANTDELRSANTTTAIRFYNDWRTSLLEDEEIARIWTQGLSAELTDEMDRFRFQQVCENVLWANVLMYDRYTSSRDSSRAMGPVGATRAMNLNPGFRECWNFERRAVSLWGYDSFIEAVESE